MIKAVVFDLYETLITTLDPNWNEANSPWQQLGISHTEYWRVFHLHYPAWMRGEIMFNDMLAAMLSPEQLEAKSQLIDKIASEHLAEKRQILSSPRAEILQLLDDLRVRGFQLGLVSNAGPDETPGWSDSPLAARLQSATFSFQVHCAKPDPDIYLHCLDKLGIEPDEAVFVGDGGSSELVGAQSVGMHPIWATWFIDAWPVVRVEDAIKNGAEQFPRIRHPQTLLEQIEQL
ncbi:MAG: HAD-IA family hydrolase [Pseudomonadota bacterium]